MKELIFLLFVACVFGCGSKIPDCTPAPVANAGGEVSIVLGLNLPKSAVLGTPAVAGSTYRWVPAEGLDNANIAQPTVTIGSSRQYQLMVSNQCGVKQDTATVSVYSE